MRWWSILIFIMLLAACGGEEKAADTPEPMSLATVQVLPVVQAMHIGDTFEGVLEAAQTPFRWTFQVEETANMIIQLARVENEDPLSLELFDPAGTSLATINVAEHDYALTNPLVLSEVGDYNILISGENVGTKYMLILIDLSPTLTPTPTDTETPTPTETPTETPTSTITPTADPPTATLAPSLTPAPTGGRLELNQTHAGEITNPGEIHRFTFVGTAGEGLGIVANPDPENPFDPALEIQAPNGDIIADNDNWRTAIPDAFISYTFEITGVYTIYLRSADNQSTGSYFITITNGFTVRDVERGEALNATPNIQRLETYGARDIWTVNLAAGDAISVDAQAVDPATLNIMVEVVAPNAEVWFDDDSGTDTNAFLGEIIAPVSGTYIIHIAARNNASIGDYQLLWQRILLETLTPIPPTVTPTPIPPTVTLTPGAPSDTIIASIDTGETFSYAIQVEAGQAVNIVVLGSSGFDPVLRISDPTDNIIVEIDDVAGATDPRTRFTAERSGLYKIEILGFEGSAGSFTLSYIVQ